MLRMDNMEELLAAYKEEGLDPAPYYWYTDQRKFGTCEHGGKFHTVRPIKLQKRKTTVSH